LLSIKAEQVVEKERARARERERRSKRGAKVTMRED